MPTDKQNAYFCYTMLKQLELKPMNWHQVAAANGISNGHAARMRWARFKKALDKEAEATPSASASGAEGPSGKPQQEKGKGKGKAKDGSGGGGIGKDVWKKAARKRKLLEGYGGGEEDGEGSSSEDDDDDCGDLGLYGPGEECGLARERKRRAVAGLVKEESGWCGEEGEEGEEEGVKRVKVELESETDGDGDPTWEPKARGEVVVKLEERVEEALEETPELMQDVKLEEREKEVKLEESQKEVKLEIVDEEVVEADDDHDMLDTVVVKREVVELSD